MRTFKRGDIVSVSLEEITALKYVPNFPEKITSTNGRVISNYRLTKAGTGHLTVQLDACPTIPNLQFHSDHVTLLVPVELDQRLTEIEEKLARLDIETEKD